LLQPLHVLEAVLQHLSQSLHRAIAVLLDQLLPLRFVEVGVLLARHVQGWANTN
jgi:hypothetical protein